MILKKPTLPKRNPRGRKGDNGRVLIVGGSPEYVGAVALTGIAAMRCGADWVTVVAPEKVGWAVNCLSPDLVVRKLKGERFTEAHVKTVLELAERHDVVVLGNGIGLEAQKFVQAFVKRCKKPLVIDADALKVIAVQDARNAILTPNLHEFEILLKNSHVKDKKGLQKKLGSNILILKGAKREVITSKMVETAMTGNAGLTKAGTGDVLAGLCGGFYGQTKDLLWAARLATYYTGVLGDVLLKKKKGFTYLASDLAQEMKRVLRH
ncbi:MAG: NAD(P)H-hydrate dehydratase [Nanoarchaeota archaeon]|nr:NAD(P)H-hydrate dehydratase [Nanoarchaeota archaeon]